MVDGGSGSKGGLRQVRLKLPVTPEDLATLRIGDIVFLDGTLYTGREGLYQRVLGDKIDPPAPLASISNVNFHCSPAASVNEDGTFNLGAVTATASFRFSKWLDQWFKMSGCKMIIGKGGMSSADYREHFVPNGAVYLTTVGYGTGALLGRGVKNVPVVHWLDELGIAQAVWVLEVENFGPLIVESDLEGNSLFEQQNALVNANVKKMYEGLKPPALARYGETTNREDEVV
ncbi:MAG: L(+)-tartrate dehydratase beta subunit [Alphaproteobacteria bacterium]|jgi:L(+)-tartrate dehydratase beta subunit